MSWYEKHGYMEDPLNTEKGAFIDKSVSLQAPSEEIAYNIEAGNLVVIEGAPGTGKTTLLCSTIEKFRGEKKVVYVDCNKNHVYIKKLLQGKYGILGKLLNLTPKNMVLLLDNFSKLSKKDVERVKYYYDNNHIRSIVFAGDSTELPDNVLDRVGNRIIRLKPLTADDAIALVKNRLGSLDFLPEKVVRQIYQKSGSDARIFLEKCRKACEEATKKAADVVSEAHVKTEESK